MGSPARQTPPSRPQSPRPEKKSDWQQYLPLALVVLGGGLLYVALQDGGGSGSLVSGRGPSARDEMVQEKVNKHLEFTAEKLELQKRRMQIENSRLALDYATSTAERPYVPQREGTELMHDRTAEDVAKDLGHGPKAKELPSNPVDLINHQLFEAEQAQASSEQYRKEYARQFVENGRRAGWDIRLSEDYRVLSVKPLKRKSAGQPLFE